MFLSRRMSDNTERSAGLRAWISPLFKISYQNIEISAVLIDILLIVFASVAGAAIYQYTWLDEIVGANVFLGIGVTSSFICIYVMHARGLYRFPVLLNPVPYLAAIFTVLTLVGLAVTAALLFMGGDDDYLLKPMVAIVLLQIALLFSARWLMGNVMHALGHL